MPAATCTRVGIGQCFPRQLFPCWGNRSSFLRIPSFVAGPASLRVGAPSSRFWLCITSTYPPPPPAPPCPVPVPLGKTLGHTHTRKTGDLKTTGPNQDGQCWQGTCTCNTSPEKKGGKCHLNSLLPLERRGGEKEKHLSFFSPLLVIFKNLSPLKEERDSRSSGILILH